MDPRLQTKKRECQECQPTTIDKSGRSGTLVMKRLRLKESDIYSHLREAKKEFAEESISFLVGFLKWHVI